MMPQQVRGVNSNRPTERLASPFLWIQMVGGTKRRLQQTAPVPTKPGSQAAEFKPNQGAYSSEKQLLVNLVVANTRLYYLQLLDLSG